MDHNPNRDGSTMGADQLDMQQRATEKAHAWSRHHAERLGVSVDELGAATLRGWTAEDVENLPAPQAANLAGPPYDPDVAAAIERIKATPVKHIETKSIRTSCPRSETLRTKPNRRKPRYQQPKDEGVSAMELAFLKAAE